MIYAKLKESPNSVKKYFSGYPGTKKLAIRGLETNNFLRFAWVKETSYKRIEKKKKKKVCLRTAI